MSADTPLVQALLIAGAFLMGSIPFGLVFTRSSGVDIRKTGSGNIGATNVLRSVGKLAAALTLLGDLLKGTAAVAIGMLFGASALVAGLMGLAAILGHDFSLFLNFKGGKGVATSLGVLLIYTPWAGLLAIGVWLLTALTFRYSSLGAIVAFAVLPFGVWELGYGWEKAWISAIISVLSIVLHRENIKRLMNGTESRIGKKSE